ncbi:anion permease [Solidesulfovibrio sp.]|uniref:anion permease n=1 Tax=Solidesulfovibrio sp. TaxID=2910990 RepID=UPI002615A0BB|nr:anion permease [Solidesulfovibrio sp.]
MKASWKAFLPIIVGAIIWFLPIPAGLTADAWHYFALFTAVIVALVLEPLPAAALGLIGISVIAALNLVPGGGNGPPKPADAVRWALSGFSNGTVWLIFVAFMFAMGYEKTGLGKRIALFLIKKLGRSTLGLGYAVALADCGLAPFTPSNTARSGGVIFPIIKNIPPLYGSTPESGARKIGAYLMWVALATTCVTSTMFLTALAPNLLALSILQKTTNQTFAWMEWFTALAPACVPLFLLLPWLIYVIYPPEIKRSEDAPRWAGDELAKMGPLSAKELTMAGLAVFALVLWIFAPSILDATTVALLALSLMIITKVVTWEDIITNKNAWNVLCWFGTLVALADGLGKVGFLKWFAGIAAAAMAGFSINAVIVGLVLIFFFVHYMFASLTAHTTALLPVFLVTAQNIPGLPLKTVSLLLCATLGIMGILTPYATGPSPVYYGSGYITPKAFWALGAVFGVIFIAFLVGIDFPILLMRGF